MHLSSKGGTLLGLLFIILVNANLSPSINPQVNHQTEMYAAPVAPSMPLPTIGHTPPIIPVSGTIRVLILAVAFRDVNSTVSVSQITKSWIGTVATYYHEISYGKLTIQGDVYGWYTLPYPETHYGRSCRSINDADCSGSNQSWHIAEDAVQLAQKNVNFNSYDYYVFIHSGKGRETSHLKDDVWSVTYTGGEIKAGSKIIERFNIVPELEEPPYVPNGVWCLEFGHNLAVPDLYNVANGPNNGRPILGQWELMDKGSWNGDPPGSLPAHMTAWPKIQLGFISGPMLAIVSYGMTSTFTVDPTEIASNNVHAIKIPITNTSSPKQYYLVEVRTKTGFDSALPAAGVLITYVNESLPVGPVRIMDGNPSVESLEDAVWNVGQTFTDTPHNLAVKVKGKVGNSYQVSITSNSQHRNSPGLPPDMTLHVNSETTVFVLGAIFPREKTRTNLEYAWVLSVTMCDRR